MSLGTISFIASWFRIGGQYGVNGIGWKYIGIAYMYNSEDLHVENMCYTLGMYNISVRVIDDAENH